MPVRVISSPSARARLDAARVWMGSRSPAAHVLIVGATRAAADELALTLARERGALFGVTRMAFSELAMKLALPVLARQELTPGGALGSEAIATRVAFEANAASELGYFAPVADLPGFPRAATRTLSDLQLASVTSHTLAGLDAAGRDLSVLLTRADEEARRAGTVTRAQLLASAVVRLRESSSALGATDIVLLDVAVTTAAEESLLAAVVASTPNVLATVPDGDRRTLDAYARLHADREESGNPREPENLRTREPENLRTPEPGAFALSRLQTWLFSADAPPPGEADESVHVFSAPGEGREAVEIARRVLREADRGVPFDEIAVLLRAPQTYFGLLEHAFARAAIPAWFERGTRRPDPAGRALLALLACADESLSARRFAEYLSLAQVPVDPGTAKAVPSTSNAAPSLRRADDLVEGTPSGVPSSSSPKPQASSLQTTKPQAPGPKPPGLQASKPEVPSRRPVEQLSLWSAPTDEVVEAVVRPEERPADPEPLEEAPSTAERDGDRIVAGTLRAPWRWEELLVEAYVIQGIDRWRRRLPGLAREYQRRLRELDDEDHDSPRVRAIARDCAELAHLESFALPIVETLDGWQTARTWGEWLREIGALVPRVLRQPTRVLRVLGEMSPLGSVGPVTLREVREVLAPRLLTLTHEPSRRRAGRVFVGTPHAARGRLFRVVFVPGLAERIFPQRLREDALLLDERRQRLNAGLAVADTRADEERLQLRLAVGAAAERVYLSYPRLELGESRPRVPSFYVLDVMRATSGAIPRYKALSEHAFSTGGASLAWPAPPDPDRAIDDMEHDLAVLRPLLRAAQRKSVEGRARYLLDLSPTLRRSVTERWLRWQPKWSHADGLIRVQSLTADALARQRLTKRPYSLTALQRYAVCPYQFQLAAMYQLAPLEEPTPLQRLDPLTRGSLFHEIQTELFRKLQANGMLPVTEARLSAARGVLDWAVTQVTTKAYDDLAPAIDRVWKDEIAGLTRDLRVWLERLAHESEHWVPERFELAFGLPADVNRDPASSPEPARVGPGFLLRGSIDLVERRIDTRALRVTDHKTGKNRTNLATIVDGGRVLQPVLYGVALEAITGETVEEGRLSFCTTQGRFSEHPIKLDPLIRRRGIEVLEIIDRAIEHGMLAARPSREACTYCDFRPVCGPEEERRTLRKPDVADLDALRKMS